MEDFVYNSITTPIYDGSTIGTGYWKFFLCFPELIGWPATAGFVILLGFAILMAARGQFSLVEWVLLAGSAAVFVVYYGVIGKFPRMGTRFVLPAVPYALILITPVLARIEWRRIFPGTALSLVLLYNLYSSIDAGLRFAYDPRMAALDWVAANVPPATSFENSYAPAWQRIAGKKYRVSNMPAATGRTELFTKLLPNNKSIQNGLARFETPYDPTTFTIEGLKSRNPDYVAFSSHVFEWSGDNNAQRFYAALDREELGYLKVFEKNARQPWPLTYPKRIDFVVDRMLVFQRSHPAGP